jgi:hypothetical protein
MLPLVHHILSFTSCFLIFVFLCCSILYQTSLFYQAIEYHVNVINDRFLLSRIKKAEHAKDIILRQLGHFWSSKTRCILSPSHEGYGIIGSCINLITDASSRQFPGFAAFHFAACAQEHTYD